MILSKILLFLIITGFLELFSVRNSIAFRLIEEVVQGSIDTLRTKYTYLRSAEVSQNNGSIFCLKTAISQYSSENLFVFLIWFKKLYPESL